MRVRDWRSAVGSSAHHRSKDSTADSHPTGRRGGDEFAIVVREADDDKAVIELGVRLIDRLSDTYEIDGHKLSIGASIGIAFGPSDGASAHILIRSADLALYRAKDAGRGVGIGRAHV